MRVSNWLKRRLVREATKIPTINLMELGRSMAQMRESLHRTAVSLGREKKVIIWGGGFAKAMFEACSEETKPEQSSLRRMHYIWQNPNTKHKPHSEAW